MAIGRIDSEAALGRFIDARLRNVTPSQISGAIPTDRLPAVRWYREVDSDPAAPDEGVLVYCIDDNGGGKRELRARFPTGAIQVLDTEP